MPQAAPQEKKDAEQALLRYESLAEAGSREKFLRTFQEQGPGNLKWVTSFNASLTDVDTTTKTVWDNYLA